MEIDPASAIDPVTAIDRGSVIDLVTAIDRESAIDLVTAIDPASEIGRAMAIDPASEIGRATEIGRVAVIVPTVLGTVLTCQALAMATTSANRPNIGDRFNNINLGDITLATR